MKFPTMKCTRWQLPRQSLLISVAAAAMLFFVLSAQAQDRIIPAVGGPGGGAFVARCPAGQLLGGLELRVGDDVDGIRPLCRKPSARLEKEKIYDPKDPHSFYPQYVEKVTYEASEAIAATGLYGGPGGGIKTLVCDPGGTGIAPIVSGIYVEAEGVDTVIVNRITLLCGGLDASGLPSGSQDQEFWKIYPLENTFEAPKYDESHTGGFEGVAKKSRGTSICPASRDNPATFAVGIHGRSGIWLDALGLICDEQKLHLLPRPKALGRVKPSTTGIPLVSICDSARRARARNSPAAPGLEAQCRAAGAAGEIAPNTLGRVKITPTDAPPTSICDSARSARARNSPAAPGLEARCRALLAATGAAIAESDPIVAAARTVETDSLYQQGFDIATAIFGDPALGAQGNTAAGPDSIGIRDTLDFAGRRGFDASMRLHLRRNYIRTSGGPGGYDSRAPVTQVGENATDVSRSAAQEMDGPGWLAKLIKDLQASAPANPPAQIESYSCRNQKVYYLQPRYCDIPSRLFDESGKVICQPGGGRTGRGDAKCSDFFEERKDAEMIRNDTRSHE